MSFPILSFDLPDSIPELNQRGSNWPTFAKLFEAEMRMRGIWSHFDGSARRPCDDDAEAAWEKVEFNAGYLLSEYLCDSTYLRMRKLETTAEIWKALVREYGMKVDVRSDGRSPHGAGSQKMKKSAQRASRRSVAESAVCMEEELTVKMPTGAESLVDVRGTDMFGDGHGDLVLGHGLASNTVWIFETDVDEVDFVGGSYFEVAEGVQGATLTATVARCEATVLCEDEVKCAS